MKCKHQFVVMRETSKMPPAPATPGIIARSISGVRTACALCGEIRDVFEDGTVQIVKSGNEQEA